MMPGVSHAQRPPPQRLLSNALHFSNFRFVAYSSVSIPSPVFEVISVLAVILPQPTKTPFNGVRKDSPSLEVRSHQLLESRDLDRRKKA
jgi:hypothetical protein